MLSLDKYADNNRMNDINGLHIAVLIISSFVIIFILFYLMRSKPEYRVSQKEKPSGTEKPGKTKPCPLCREPLKPGETVHSVLYPGKPDSLMEIFGCPYCEKPGSKNNRVCPVCRKEMYDDGLVIARVFDKPGKKHVHVLGCNVCYSGKTSINKII